MDLIQLGNCSFCFVCSSHVNGDRIYLGNVQADCSFCFVRKWLALVGPGWIDPVWVPQSGTEKWLYRGLDGPIGESEGSGFPPRQPPLLVTSTPQNGPNEMLDVVFARQVAVQPDLTVFWPGVLARVCPLEVGPTSEICSFSLVTMDLLGFVQICLRPVLRPN